MKCPHCGQDDPGTNFCCACGRRLPSTGGTGEAERGGAKAGEASIAKPARALAVLEPGTVLRGRYEISNEKWPDGKNCSEGGQGVVYYAVDRQAEGRPCVVKQARELVTSDAVYERLREEAKHMAEMSRAIGGRMAEILEDFVQDGRFYVVEQRIYGETLQSIFEKTHPLREDDVVGWTIQCCSILQRIHECNVLHRDISPDNLMLTPVGDIMFIDFGTLREFQRILQGTKGMGKYGYTPPEQWRGSPVVQSDIFSLAATAYYLLTGFLPVSDDFKAGKGFQPSDLLPVFPPITTVNPSLSEGLERVLLRALDLDTRQRYASADDMRSDLEKLCRRGQTAAPALDVRSCPKCGGLNEQHLVYCRHCETVLSGTLQQCQNPKCKSNKGRKKGIPGNARFCPGCGMPTSAA